ncbi:MAG: hypothetical protein ACPGJF_08500 [Sinimarinibacterium flocculans]|uniref:hypothetical protein n=1 Tax=Sinimarinibacterium flocculans TaxID=985250 RepID=UPI003C5A08D8
MKTSNYRAAGAAAVFALTACGGETRFPAPVDPVSNVEVRTKADATRELGNVIWFFGLQKYELVGGIYRGVYGPVDEYRFNPRSQPDQEALCEDGSVSLDVTREPRSFDFFPTSQTVDSQERVYRQCRETIPPVITYDGAYEIGESAVDGEGATYRYVRGGTESGAFVIDVIGDSTDSRSQISGLTESRFTDVMRTDSSRSELSNWLRYRADFTQDAKERIVSYELELGSELGPFTTTVDNSGQGSYSGAYRYSTNVCDGGELALETLTPLRISDTAPPRFIAGTLRISSGPDSVTVTFSSDGSAALLFANGEAAAVSTDEMNTLYSYDPLGETVGGRICAEGIKE